MATVDVVFMFFVVFLLIFVWSKINPKIDYNTITGHYLLWINDPFDYQERKAIVLWKKI